MQNYLSWSGGKDSTASIILCYLKGLPLDGIVMSEVMFDHSRNISGEHIQIVGIAADEPKRLARLFNTNKRSILAEYNVTEQMAYDICAEYNLLSPLYQIKSRGGCWFCPNQGYRDFAVLKKEYFLLWQELKKLSESENLASNNFKYGETFAQVEKKVDFINNQLSIFDF